MLALAFFHIEVYFNIVFSSIADSNLTSEDTMQARP